MQKIHTASRIVEVVAALIWQNDRFLICRRPPNKGNPLLWEFVGGKVEPGESKTQALVRECWEELGIEIAAGEVYAEKIHTYPDATVHLTFFRARIVGGIPQMREHMGILWITPEEIPQYDFCPADTDILQKIAADHPPAGYTYRKATLADLELIWDKSIAQNSDDPRWSRWKEQYIGYNQSGMAQTYVVLCNGDPVGEGTLLFAPDCRAVRGRLALADGQRIANVNALRIEKKHEGKGHISRLMHLMEQDAAARGYTALTIGVEAAEARNLAIYLHWGYTRLVTIETEDGAHVLYYGKTI